jgi:hypothetical protein
MAAKTDLETTFRRRLIALKHSARRRETGICGPRARGGWFRGPASSHRDDAGSCPRFRASLRKKQRAAMPGVPSEAGS